MSSVFQSFVGVDLHKCTVTLTAVDAAGESIRLKISTKSTGKIEAWLRALPGPVWMAVEACPFVEWFIDRFGDSAERIDIADQTFADFIDLVMLTERHRERLRREIIFATRSVRFAPIVSLLLSVPGIGEIWAAIIAAEIGPFETFERGPARDRTSATNQARLGRKKQVA
jgi:hypothetical protein